MNYYKTIKNNISFSEAIDAFKNGQIIKYGPYFYVINPSEVNLKDIRFTIEQVESNEWAIVEPDTEMNEHLDYVRDMMDEMNLDIDSRFYHEDKMDIGDYWRLFEEQFIDDKLAFDIIEWIYVNKKYNKKY